MASKAKRKAEEDLVQPIEKKANGPLIIDYLDPENMEPLTSEQKIGYEHKVVPFKFYVPGWLFVAGGISFEEEDGHYRDVSEEEYKKQREEYKVYPPIPKIIIGNPLQVTSNQGYLWNFAAKDKALFDDIDRKLVQNNGTGFICAHAMALHTYGGYYGMFRPDLVEVCKLLRHSGILPDTVERIYVTTEAYPSEKIQECYNNTADKHQAKTTWFIVPRKVLNQ